MSAHAFEQDLPHHRRHHIPNLATHVVAMERHPQRDALQLREFAVRQPAPAARVALGPGPAGHDAGTDAVGVPGLVLGSEQVGRGRVVVRCVGGDKGEHGLRGGVGFHVQVDAGRGLRGVVVCVSGEGRDGFAGAGVGVEC